MIMMIITGVDGEGPELLEARQAAETLDQLREEVRAVEVVGRPQATHLRRVAARQRLRERPPALRREVRAGDAHRGVR